jgi:hypothetical protein
MKSHEERLLTAAEDGRLSVVKRIISTRKASVSCCDSNVSRITDDSQAVVGSASAR